MSDNSVTITGVNKKQIKLLDKMWSLDSYDEYNEWKATLTAGVLTDVLLLEELLLLADIDNFADEDVSDAAEVLAKFI